MAIMFAVIPIVLLIAFCSYASPGTVHDPYVTWNLYVAPTISALTAALILLFMDRKFKSQDKKDERIATLLAEKESRKESDIKEWRELYTRKIDCVKQTVDKIEEDMHSKVPYDFCHGKEREIKGELKEHDERLRKVGG